MVSSEAVSTGLMPMAAMRRMGEPAMDLPSWAWSWEGVEIHVPSMAVERAARRMSGHGKRWSFLIFLRGL